MSKTGVPRIFSDSRREARAERARRMAARSHAASWLFDEMQSDIIERLEFMRFRPARALLAGHAAGRIAHHLERGGTSLDIAHSLDEEQPLTGGPFDLVVSLARLDTVNDLPGALLHIREALAPSGLMIAQFPGAGSLAALRQTMLAADADRPAARIHPQIDDRAASALLQRAGFSRQVVDTHRLTVRYSAFERLVRDLREQALNSVLMSPAPYVGKSGLARAEAKFEQLREADGKVSEHFHILTLTGWR